MSNFLYLEEDDIASAVTLNDAIVALEQGLKWLGEDSAINIPKALATFGDGASLHSLGSAFPLQGWAGFKNWVHTKNGATAMYVMFDTRTGELAALMEAFLLGQLRTAAIAGVATRWMSDSAADEMALIGTGAQAMAQLAGVAAVRRLRRVRVFSPTTESRTAFVDAARKRFSFEIQACDTLESAVGDVPIVTLVTRARAPFLKAEMLAKGTHINAMGAILPANSEFEDTLFDRADVVAVDDLANAKRASREFIDHYEHLDQGWADVQLLSDIIASGRVRRKDDDLSIFKAMGMGISDLSMAIAALERARELGLGKSSPHPVRAEMVWKEMESSTP